MFRVVEAQLSGVFCSLLTAQIYYIGGCTFCVYRGMYSWSNFCSSFFSSSVQGIWLAPAYLLEFQGYNTLMLIWLAGLLFFAINVYVLARIITNHQFRPTFLSGQTSMQHAYIKVEWYNYILFLGNLRLCYTTTNPISVLWSAWTGKLIVVIRVSLSEPYTSRIDWLCMYMSCLSSTLVGKYLDSILCVSDGCYKLLSWSE